MVTKINRGIVLRLAKYLRVLQKLKSLGFVKVFSNIQNFRHEGSFEGWVRRIMVNVSLSKFRKQNILYPVEDATKFETPTWTEEILDKIAAEDLIGLIQQLPPRYRMVFNLFVMEGMSHQEIGEAMNISEGTSKSNLARARDILKRKVQELYSEVKTNANYPA